MDEMFNEKEILERTVFFRLDLNEDSIENTKSEYQRNLIKPQSIKRSQTNISTNYKSNIEWVIYSMKLYLSMKM